MGPLLRMWQAHDNEILCSLSINDARFATSSVDQTIAVSRNVTTIQVENWWR